VEHEQAELRERYGRTVGSEEFCSLPMVAQHCYHVLHARALDPEDGGPDVMASVRVLAASIEDVYGRRYSLRAISFGVRSLEEAGFLGITHGVAYNGWEQARASVYHLLQGAYFTSPRPGAANRACEVLPAPSFLARVQMAFRAAIELVRRYKFAVRESRFTVRWEHFVARRERKLRSDTATAEWEAAA
jgi:hypothetical protein